LDKLSLPLPLPDGETEESLFDYLKSYHFTDSSDKNEVINYLKNDFKRFVYTLSLVPQGSGNLLEIGGNPYFTSMLLHKFRNYDLKYTNYFGGELHTQIQQKVNDEGELISFPYWNHNVEESDLPFDDEYFDVVLCCEVIEHFVKSPLYALMNIRKHLKENGTLILTTPNVARLENIAKMISGGNIYDPYSGYGIYGRHNREYNKHELYTLLTHCGFKIESIFSSDVHNNASDSFYPVDKILNLITDIPHRELDLGQYIFVKATKSGEVDKRLPEWLYRSFEEQKG
jgi:SAM-dependent methyltransferase